MLITINQYSINVKHIFSLEESVLFEETKSIGSNNKEILTTNEIATIRLTTTNGTVIDLLNITLEKVTEQFNQALSVYNVVMLQVGGHVVNPRNVVNLEEYMSEQESVIKTSNDKEVTKTITVPVIKIVGVGGCEIDIMGIAKEDIETNINMAMNISNVPETNNPYEK